MRHTLHHLDNAGITPDAVMQVGKRMLEATLDLMPEEELAAIPKLEHLLGRKLQDGRQEGRLEGRQEEAAAMLLKLLYRKFGQTPDWVIGKVGSARLEWLEAWGENLLFANTLDEVFAS
ncbi:MAG: DUF4351 domain-containing protein [Magnetococcales bacterium]|nr:DUF4351 domain-containing protein [Magnetococcales bacterium]